MAEVMPSGGTTTRPQGRAALVAAARAATSVAAGGYGASARARALEERARNTPVKG